MNLKLALIGAALVSFTAAPSIAAPLVRDATLPAVHNADVEHVQYRRGYHRGSWDRGRHWDRGRNRNSGAAALGGLAAGTIIGGAIANSQARQYDRNDAYCSQRFRSYDPASGTYLGYDGNRHPCP